jgi:hypothetical protein
MEDNLKFSENGRQPQLVILNIYLYFSLTNLSPA